MEAFNIRNSLQCATFERELKIKLYSRYAEATHKTPWLRIAGFGLGVASAVLTIIFRVAQLAEALIKAFGNLFGAICSKNCDWKLGLKQLFIVFPLSFIDVVISPLHGLIGTGVTTLGMAIEPVNYVTKRIAAHATSLQNSLIGQIWSQFPTRA